MTPEQAVAHLRSTKHRLWLARKRLWSTVEPAAAPAIDASMRIYSSWRPPAPSPPEDVEAEPAPLRLFCLWTGDNPMSANRVRAMQEIRRFNEAELDVVLVDSESLSDWIVPGHPLHPSYQHLALIHRSDYLRTYLMHHHGGGYSDVKAAKCSWMPVLEQLNADPHAWIVGYRERSYRDVAPVAPPLRRRLHAHHSRLLGNGAYIAKPRTPFTAAWLAEAERRLDAWQGDLLLRPGEIYGAVGYPVPFYGLLGEIFHPLCLQYHDRLRHDDRLTPQLHDYK